MVPQNGCALRSCALVSETRPGISKEGPAHDILAAEAFALPAPEPPQGAALPADPTGMPEPHDILAAEEFAMPAPDPVVNVRAERDRARRARIRWTGVMGAGLLALLLRRRRR